MFMKVCDFNIFKNPSPKLYFVLIKFLFLSLYILEFDNRDAKGYKTKIMPPDKNAINNGN